MQNEELIKKVNRINIKITNVNKEIDELALSLKQKRLEVKKYKNERARIQLKIKEFEIENWKSVQQERRQRENQRNIMKKYAVDPNNEYYSQDNSYLSKESSFIKYMEKKVVPYND